MKEIIPLKKDIIFKTKIGQITNISLDHDYKINNDLINGSVDVTGSYKMTEASVIEEDFYYSIPFSIALSKNIKENSVKIEIEDFKYNISKDILNVFINLELTCEENEEKDDKIMNNYFDDDVLSNIESDFKIEKDNILINDVDNEIEENNQNIVSNNDINTNITNITNNIIDSSDKYYTYKVYIVRENDTIDTICNKYNVGVNDLKEYNDITDIKVGDKIIIPASNE